MGKYSDRLLNPEPESVAPETQASQQQPKEEGWGEWIVNSVKGRQDPAFEGVGSIVDIAPELKNSTKLPALAGASDAQMTDILASELGDRFVKREKDANDYDVLTFKDQAGNSQRGYVNTPGLDQYDVSRGVFGALPYVATGGAAGAALKGAPIIANAAAQGLAAGVTSIAGDVAQMPMGSQQGVELGKAAVNTTLGFVAPPITAAVGAAWRRFVTIPGMIDSAGNLTTKGGDAARKAGLDPNALTPDMANEFAASYAKSGDAVLAASRSTTEPMGIPVSQGQQTKRPYLLNQEEKIRRGLYGETAEREMLSFDALQRQRIEEAAFAGGQTKGVGETLSPDRMGRGDAQRLGDNIQDTLQAARRTAKREETALWEGGGVKELAATDEALGTLRDSIGAALTNETAFTKTGEAMAKTIGEFVEKKLPVSEAGGIQLKQVQTVDQMRRRLFDVMKSAEPGSDQRQAGMVYDAFNEWIGDSAKKSLLAGDPMAAAQLVKARAFTRDVRSLFSPTDAGFRTSAGGRRMTKAIENADSGEGVIQSLLGAPGGRSPPDGAATALTQVKSILDRFGGNGAKQAWDDIRLANWNRLVLGKNGEMLGPQAITNNIKSALANQRTILDTLYKPDEINQMRNFMRATEVAAYKPPNASGSGYTAAEAIKELTGKFLNLVPGSQYIRAGLDVTGLPQQVGAMRARAAISQAVPVRRPNVAPVVVGVGSQTNRD